MLLQWLEVFEIASGTTDFGTWYGDASTVHIWDLFTLPTAHS